MKPSKCKVCGHEFQKQRPLQKVCSPACALQTARDQTKKRLEKEKREDRRQVKEKLDAMKKKPELLKNAQQAFNAYIRARDAGKTCISCETLLTDAPNTFDSGHYRSVGSARHMRFVETNVHGQCKHCNNFLAGNHVEYRKRLIQRVGLEEVERIESDNALRKYTHEGLREIAKQYRQLAKTLKK